MGPMALPTMFLAANRAIAVEVKKVSCYCVVFEYFAWVCLREAQLHWRSYIDTKAVPDLIIKTSILD